MSLEEIYKDASFMIKVLSEPNSTNQLLIPDAFVQKYGEMLPQEAFLMTSEKYGRCVKVEIAQLDNGRFCFADGWPEFVAENPQICSSDYLVFKLVEALTFRVSIFGKDGLKKPSSNLRRPQPSTPRDVVTNSQGKNRTDCTQGQHRSESGVEMDGMKSFSTVFTEQHLYCMNIPMYFAVKTGIALRSNIRLKNKNGVSWDLQVFTQENDGQICLRGLGWEDFWIKNCLTFGSIVTFTVIGDDFGTLHVSTNPSQEDNGEASKLKYN